MADKSTGIDFDRQVFAEPQTPATRPTPRVGGILFAVVIAAAVFFLAYKLLPQMMRESGAMPDAGLAAINERLGSMEARLEKLEAARRNASPARSEEKSDAKEKESAAKPAPKTIYRISPAPKQPSPPPAKPAGPDVATDRRLTALQSDADANREAWQATTDKLAEVAGQVGTQGVDILRNQDELNALLARTEMQAIPFELLRGSTPQPVGPVSLTLKSTNPKAKRYSLCVSVSGGCIDLKDRTIFEVVRFVASRNTAPLEVIATKVIKDHIVGYLEVPRELEVH